MFPEVRQAREWEAAALLFKRISAKRLFGQTSPQGFCRRVAAVLAETGIDPRYLDLELTEGVLIADAKSTNVMLHAVKCLGLHFAVDDFGPDIPV